MAPIYPGRAPGWERVDPEFYRKFGPGKEAAFFTKISDLNKQQDLEAVSQALLPHNQRLIESHTFGWSHGCTGNKEIPCVLIRADGRARVTQPLSPVCLVPTFVLNQLMDLGAPLVWTCNHDFALFDVPKKARPWLGRRRVAVSLHRLVYWMNHEYQPGVDLVPVIHPRLLHPLAWSRKKPGKKRKANTIPTQNEVELTQALHAYNQRTIHSSYYAIQTNLEKLLVPVHRANLQHLIVPNFPTK